MQPGGACRGSDVSILAFPLRHTKKHGYERVHDDRNGAGRIDSRYTIVLDVYFI